MDSLIKYFEVKHDIKELIKEDEEISKSKKLNVFFKIILEYYYNHDIPLDYTDMSVTINMKDIIIKRVYPVVYNEKSIKMFDLMDFMFKTFKKIIKKTHLGYLDSLGKFGQSFTFTRYIISSIDLFFYIIFIHVLPEELRYILRNELKLSNIEYKILNKCSDILIRENSKICDLRNPEVYQTLSPINDTLQIDSIKSKSTLYQLISKSSNDLSVEKSMGFMMLLKIFTDLRDFKDRI